VSPAGISSDSNARPRFLISDLCAYLESYLNPDQIQEVYRAYLFSAEAHEGQQRLTGEPYIYHPLAVARILAAIQMDHQCLMAAILHDVIEDTAIGKEQVAELFGQEIAELVLMAMESHSDRITSEEILDGILKLQEWRLEQT